MTVLYEDNHLLVVEKPVNVPVQADASEDADLLTMCKAYIKEKYNKPGEVFLGLVHRLDRPVGGVMVFARTSKAAARLTSQFASHGAKKRYAALTCGDPLPRKRLEGSLYRDERTGTSAMVAPETPGAKSASLEYERLSRRGALTLLDISLQTGRHHQIRCQLADAGLSLWGDQRYNPAAVPGEQLALWAYSLGFDHPTRGERLTFTSLPSGGAWKPFHTELAALCANVRVVYADENLLCVNKEAGVCVAERDGENSLESTLGAALGEEIFPIHRLDVATRGLVLFARNSVSRDALEEAISARSIKKFYRCTVYRRPQRERAELRAWLVKDAENARVYVYDGQRPGAKEIITRYRTLSREKETTELEVELVTGRTHQIRAHMAHIGHPLVGDDRYGDRERDRASGARTLALCAVRLELHFNEKSPLACLEGKIISIED